MKTEVIERFIRKFRITETCWEWEAGKDRNGYGRFGIERKNRLAHRICYELLIGKIPDTLGLDHLCRNPSCVNPAHLEPVTHRENVLRGFGASAINAKKTHCPQGHPLSGDNLFVERYGGRRCRLCKNKSRMNNYYTKHER